MVHFDEPSLVEESEGDVVRVLCMPTYYVEAGYHKDRGYRGLILKEVVDHGYYERIGMFYTDSLYASGFCQDGVTDHRVLSGSKVEIILG
jgi:hypothetical protein